MKDIWIQIENKSEILLSIFIIFNAIFKDNTILLPFGIFGMIIFMIIVFNKETKMMKTMNKIKFILIHLIIAIAIIIVVNLIVKGVKTL